MNIYKMLQKGMRTTKIAVFLTDGVTEEEWQKLSDALMRTPLSSGVKRALSKKNTDTTRGSIAARALLFGLFSPFFYTSCGPLLKTRHGAPYFKDGTRVSISHTRGAVAVAVSTDPRFALGVDIERNEYNTARAEGVERRFLSTLADGGEWTEEAPLLARLVDPVTLAFSFEPLLWEASDDRFLFRFTRAEAVMKTSGRGFGAHSRLSRLSHRSEISTVKFSSAGAAFTLSYARRKRSAFARHFGKY